MVVKKLCNSQKRGRNSTDFILNTNALFKNVNISEVCSRQAQLVEDALPSIWPPPHHTEMQHCAHYCVTLALISVHLFSIHALYGVWRFCPWCSTYWSASYRKSTQFLSFFTESWAAGRSFKTQHCKHRSNNKWWSWCAIPWIVFVWYDLNSQ